MGPKLRLSKVVIIFLCLQFTGCLKFSSNNTSNSNSNVTSNNHNGPQITSGTLDLRSGNNLSITGNYSEKKLMNTILVIRGAGGKILKSGPASLFKNGRKFYINYDYTSITIEEKYNGNSILTRYKSYKDGLNYRLKL